jgi:serine/threonine protein kinase/pimeloyl-ACP methyl ester carboxylesterase/Flp pilus assembly protein TadD
MEQQIHFCTTDDGVRIAYATVGEGPPLVKAANWLNHLEFDWRSPIWRHLLQEFSRDHTFVRYDERGNGLSDWNVADLSLDAWVEDLASVVKATDVDRFPLLGISQGGAVAIAYAVRHPDKVSHLILYGAYARGWAKRESSEEIEQRQAQLTLVRLGWGKDNPAFRQLWTTLYAPDATPEQAQSFNDLQRVSTSPENAFKLLNVMGDIDVVDLLPQVKVPTLVLHCRDDSAVPFEEGRLLAAMIPGARFVPLEGKNHLLLEAEPAWTMFVNEVRRFLGTAPTTTGETKVKDAGSRDRPKFTQADLPKRYSILSSLGAGGMGEVYLAEDTRLGRKVALKTLPSQFTNDKERLRRFQQEARAASALNHPNILTIHEIGADSGAHFIATEFVDGETLRAKLNRGRIKLDEALDVAQQTAFALTAAHGAAIVHRDIKPENIMVRHDGILKVLDFGLAKLLEDHAREMIDHEAETRALVLTDPGRVLGTPAYMSPEQARGLDLDARTDIWSLGVVLYEMVAGRAPFRGETRSHTVVSILETEPAPLATFAPETPAELQRIVRKALTKDRDSRYQTARDLMIDLKTLRRDLDIQSEIRRSSGPDISATDSVANQKFAANDSDAALSEQATSLAEPRPTRSDGPTPDGSIRYRIGALVAMLLLALAALGVWYYFHRQNTGPAIESIAVLPFVNESGNDDMEYLSDGISESLINSLSQLPGVKVIARSSSFQYKGKNANPQEVARALGVEAILTGRVLERGDNLLISVELVNARDSTQMWGEQYNRKLTDILVVQQEISREVSEKLRLKLTGAEQQRITKPYTESAEAYELFLKGRYSHGKSTEEGLKKAIEYYQQAINKDPNYALAYAEMGNAFEALGGVLGFASPVTIAPQGKAAIMKALMIDDTLADAHAALADFKLYFDWDWPDAEKGFRRALELDPNQWKAHAGYGTYLESLGRFDEAVAERERSRQLDPTSPIAIADVGYPSYYARRFDEALGRYRKAIELDPEFSWGHLWIGQVYVQQGKYGDAIAEIKKAIALSDGNVRDIATLGHAYGVAGQRSEALKIIAELQERARQKYVSPYFFALVYVGLGDKDQAFAQLDQAYQERHPYLILIKVEPVFDGLHSDPRFADLVRRIGVPQ